LNAFGVATPMLAIKNIKESAEVIGEETVGSVKIDTNKNVDGIDN
jgi:hypothetical protein